MKILALLLLALCACIVPMKRTSMGLPTEPRADCHSWNKLPVRVQLQADAEGYRGAVNIAMGWWNDAVGRQVFVWAPDGVAADVVVFSVAKLWDAPRKDHVISGATQSYCVLGGVYSDVTLRQGMDDVEAPVIAAHELGHVLGLGHSTNETSVMRYFIDSRLMSGWDEEDEPSVYFVIDSDVSMVNALHP